MPKLLLEIGCEELPASACREAAAQLPELARKHLGAEPSRLLIGPRRLAFLVDELPERTEAEWVKGPPENLRERAAAGFAKRHGLAAEDLTVRDGFLGVEIPGRPVAEVLPESLVEIVRGLAFGKSMVWRAGGIRFSRPVRWLLAKLDAQTIVLDLEGIPSGDTTWGHRVTHGQVQVPDAGAYVDVLRSVDIEPDADERRRLILEGLPEGWSDPMGKLEEVIHLVESPSVLEASFDERFLQLPRRVIETAMQSHQRYFPLGGNRFAVVANGGDSDIVRVGHTRVLENRLDDASFTFERDVKQGIDELAQRLGAITFYAKAGSFADKSERLVRLVGELGGGEASAEAARLAKADQAAELVREFPDLEGHIGAEYARLAGYPEAVCAAIEEQYLPDSAGGPLPATEAGRVLAAADKIDNLNVAFGLGRRPTGSRDPFGLRRDAIGLCRIATEGGLAIPRAVLEDDVRDFVEERLEGLLDVPVEFVRAARASNVEELGQVAALARALAALDDERLGRLHTVFTRAARIVDKADERDLPELRGALLSEPAEQAVEEARGRAAAVLDGTPAFDDAVAAASELADPLERFFEEVHVMAEDPDVRRNRLRLLRDVRELVAGALGDFSQIPR